MVSKNAIHRGAVRLFPFGTVVAGLLTIAVLEISTSHVHATSPSEYELKAVFLLNFVRFTNWPQSVHPPGNAPLVVGILGADPFGDSLDAVFVGEKVAGHSLQIRRFSRHDDYRDCHLLFICRSESPHLPQIFSTLTGRHVLTVSDIDQFIYKDGMIGMLMEQNCMRVQINYDKTRSAELELSAKLLKVSFVLRKKPHSLLRTYTKALCRQGRSTYFASTIE